MTLIDDLLKTEKKLHFTLIDPEDQLPMDAASIAKECESYGTDAIMIGGSTVKSRKQVYDTIEAIKKNVSIPVILFPNSAESIAENADYIFFMSLLNSRDDKYLIREPVKGALLVKKFGIKPISMAYIVVSTSEIPTMVERVVKLDRINGSDTEKAVDYALTAKYFGMNCIYLEAGSGATKPVPNEIIHSVRNAIDIPIIVGGGIKDAKTAKEKVDSGADVIVNGTLVQRDRKRIKEIIEGIKKEKF